MDREQFYFLYVNANSLAELGLMQALQDIESLPVATPADLPPMTEDELQAHLEKQFADMDLSALDGIDYDFFKAPVEGSADGVAGEPSAPAPPPAETRDIDALSAEGPLDVDAYMLRAYGHESTLRERVDRAFAAADLPALDRIVAGLPAELPPITGQLADGQTGRWLGLMGADHPALSELVTEIRRLTLENPA